VTKFKAEKISSLPVQEKVPCNVTTSAQLSPGTAVCWLQPQDEQCRTEEHHPSHQVNKLHVSFYTFRLQACFSHGVVVLRVEYIIV